MVKARSSIEYSDTPQPSAWVVSLPTFKKTAKYWRGYHHVLGAEQLHQHAIEGFSKGGGVRDTTVPANTSSYQYRSISRSYDYLPVLTVEVVNNHIRCFKSSAVIPMSLLTRFDSPHESSALMPASSLPSALFG